MNHLEFPQVPTHKVTSEPDEDWRTAPIIRRTPSDESLNRRLYNLGIDQNGPDDDGSDDEEPSARAGAKKRAAKRGRKKQPLKVASEPSPVAEFMDSMMARWHGLIISNASEQEKVSNAKRMISGKPFTPVQLMRGLTELLDATDGVVDIYSDMNIIHEPEFPHLMAQIEAMTLTNLSEELDLTMGRLAELDREMKALNRRYIREREIIKILSIKRDKFRGGVNTVKREMLQFLTELIREETEGRF